MSKQTRSGPVMQAVLDAVSERLENGDESLIRIPEICEATGVNYGSVYHHFGSREGVIDAAYAMMFTKLVESDLATIRGVADESTSIDEFVVRIQPFIEQISATPERRHRRNVRVRIVAAALTRPELRDIIGEIQSDITNRFTELVARGQELGWLRPDVSPRAVAVVLQVLVFGRTLDDVSTTPLAQDEWDTFGAVLFQGLLAPPT